MIHIPKGPRLAQADPSLATYLAHRADLLKYADSIVRVTVRVPEDLVQEAWLSFSLPAAQAAPITHPTSYLYSIVRNTNAEVGCGGRRATWSTRALPKVMEAVPGDAPSAEQVLYYRDELRAFDAVLSRTTRAHWQALILYRYEKWTLPEIADVLKVSVARRSIPW